MLALTYLGVAGWHLTGSGFSLLVDPYVTRLSLVQVALGYARPDAAAIAAHIPPADALLVTHPHYDHVMDVPEVIRQQHIPAYASSQGCALLAVLGVEADNRHVIESGDNLTFGPFHVEVFPSTHRTIFGQIPYLGPLRTDLSPPLRPADYRIRQQFSFRIAQDDWSILVASGIDNEPAVPADVLLVGADASTEQLQPILDGVQPRLVLPNHWDDMFRPYAAPVRPMLVPPRQRVFLPRRINLDDWARRVRSICPAAHVIIPKRGQPLDLATLLS